MNKKYWTLLLIAILMSSLGLSAQEYKSGDADIDKLRVEIKTQKTTEANYKERTKILYMWMGALQQQGANTFPFFDLDYRYRTLETEINNTPASIIRSDSETDELRASRQAQEQQQNILEQAPAMAGAARDLAEAQAIG